MKLSYLAPKDAVGHVTVHALATSKGKIAKGSVLSADDVHVLVNDGAGQVACAVAEAGDLNENEAASRLSKCLEGAGIIAGSPFTGRVNFTTKEIGIIRYNNDLLKNINMVDEGITLALVQHNQVLAAGDMIATLKIIPFFVSEASVAAVEEILKTSSLMTFHPFSARKAALIQSRFDHQPDSLFAATEKVTSSRLSQLGSVLAMSQCVAHDEKAITAGLNAALESGAELILVAGASAIADRGDVIPAAVIAAGGQVDHFGMAVDPGNLLMLGHIGHTPVIGMPGCARSPKLNGLDWILHLLLAGIIPDRSEFAEMAAGGLLMEIASRPLPRALVGRKPKPRKMEGVLLAAGTSSRMGTENKLLMDWGGRPMIRHIAEAMAESDLGSMTVILGHDAEQVAAALDGLDARLLFNPNYQQGQSTSLQVAFDHLETAVTDLLVMLGDMPLVDAEVINSLINAHNSLDHPASRITLPVIEGRRGHPVIWGESFFGEMANIKGDTGARPLFETYPDAINGVPFDRPELLLDADTRKALDLMRDKAGFTST